MDDPREEQKKQEEREKLEKAQTETTRRRRVDREGIDSKKRADDFKEEMKQEVKEANQREVKEKLEREQLYKQLPKKIVKGRIIKVRAANTAQVAINLVKAQSDLGKLGAQLTVKVKEEKECKLSNAEKIINELKSQIEEAKKAFEAADKVAQDEEIQRIGILDGQEPPENYVAPSLEESDKDLEIEETRLAGFSIICMNLYREFNDTLVQEGQVYPMRGMDEGSLRRIIRYCNLDIYKDAAPVIEKASLAVAKDPLRTRNVLHEIPEEVKEIIPKDKVELALLMNAVHYWDMPTFLDSLVKHVANLVKSCQNVEKMREEFGIVSDFTPTEEEAIKKETEFRI